MRHAIKTALSLLFALAFAAAPAMARDHDRGHDHGRDHGRSSYQHNDRGYDRSDYRRGDRDRHHYRGDDRRYGYRDHDYRNDRRYYQRPRVVYRPVHVAPRWVRGGRYYDRGYGPTYVVNDYYGYGLRTPPRGYYWRRSDAGDFLLVALATGVIADLVLGH